MDKNPKKIDVSIQFAAYGTVVKIDGVPVPYVREVQVIHRAGDCPKLLLEVVPEGGIEVMGESYVSYRPSTSWRLLIAFRNLWRKLVPFRAPVA